MEHLSRFVTGRIYKLFQQPEIAKSKDSITSLQSEVDMVTVEVPRIVADRVVEVVKDEMKNNQVFAKHAFHIQAGQETVDSLIEK